MPRKSTVNLGRPADGATFRRVHAPILSSFKSHNTILETLTSFFVPEAELSYQYHIIPLCYGYIPSHTMLWQKSQYPIPYHPLSFLPVPATMNLNNLASLTMSSAKELLADSLFYINSLHQKRRIQWKKTHNYLEGEPHGGPQVNQH